MTNDQSTRDQETIRSLLFLIASIRQAAGDADARLMQDELVARVKSIHDALAEYADLLDSIISHLRAAEHNRIDILNLEGLRDLLSTIADGE